MMICSYPYAPSIFTGVAKAGKKLKTHEPSKDAKVNESVKQASIVSEASIQNLEDAANDPPPEAIDAIVDPMDIDADPPSPKPPSPAKPVKEATMDKSTGDTLITGTGYTEPETPQSCPSTVPKKSRLQAEN